MSEDTPEAVPTTKPNADNPAPNENKTSLADRIVTKIEKEKSSTRGKLAGYIIGLILFVATISGFQYYLNIDYTSISLIPQSSLIWIILSLAIFSLTALMVFKGPEKKSLQLLGFLGIIVLAVPFVMVGQTSRSHELIIVYDDTSPKMHPEELIGVNAYPLNELLKVAQLREISPKSTFISTVDKPSDHWDRTFRGGFNPVGPVLSIQEVLKSDEARFIDISYSSFENELSFFISRNLSDSTPLVIFFENSYASSEQKLRASIREAMPNLKLKSVIYDGQEQSLDVTPETAILYLGSPEKFYRFFDLVDDEAHSMLILPNWIRPLLENSVTQTETKKNVVVLSSIFDDFASKDIGRWNELVELVNEALVNDEDIFKHVRSAFVDEKTIVEVRY